MVVEHPKEIGVTLAIRPVARRHAANRVVQVVSSLGALIGLGILVWILAVVVMKGLGAFDLAFFTRLPTPPGITGGGLVNAIVGTLIMTVLAAAVGTPIGILAGVYLAEFGRGSKFAVAVRSLTNILTGVPSIIVGVFVYTLLVVPAKSFSGYAGAAALAIIMLPIVVRTTEDMLNLVPNSLREAGLALGAPRWRVITSIVFRAARNGLITGVLLSVARVSGETAPLLFTALNSPFWIHSLNQPTPNLTVTIFNYAMSPFADWKTQAWGASLLITAGVLVLNIGARLLFRRGKIR
ncbi:MAG: phosphate ABC transporter permease PstA [Candidatus Zixiibacteriota bacterium]|nr:MAG: phosphate ABC transporter permease PstA [candidate division Zixibacteria bacterium]